MRSISMLVLGGVVMTSALAANQGCGCGPIKGAYLTSAVIRYDASGWVDAPALARGRAFAVVVPIDTDRYLVAGGYNAERDSVAASGATTAELCSLTSGCAIYGELDRADLSGWWLGVGSGVGSLTDGTIVTTTLLVRPDGGGSFMTDWVDYTVVVQQGAAVLAQTRDDRVAVYMDGSTPPRVLGPFPGATLVAALDDSRALLVSQSQTLVLDVDSGSVEALPGPGMSIERTIGCGADALVFGFAASNHKARRFDAVTMTWRDVPSLEGQLWTVELGLRDGAILSQGDPDAEGKTPYRVFRYRAADDSLVPMPTTPGFDYGATWMEMPDGAVIRVGGAQSRFDDEATLAAS